MWWQWLMWMETSSSTLQGREILRASWPDSGQYFNLRRRKQALTNSNSLSVSCKPLWNSVLPTGKVVTSATGPSLHFKKYPGILEWMKWPSSGRPKPINCAWAVVRDTEESQAGQIVLWGLQRWRQKAIQGINAALNILWNVCMQKDPWLLPETNSDTMEFSRPVGTGQKVSDSVSTSMEMCMCAWLRSECTGTKGLTSTLGKYSSNKPS